MTKFNKTKTSGKLTKWLLAECLSKLFGRAAQQDAVMEAPFTYVGRLNCDEISGFLAKSLGRQLTQVEVAALDAGYRPQGLLDPDDSYSIRLASPRYLGTFAPEVEVFGTAVAGYADGESQLKLAETVSVHFDDGVDVIDNELVAAF